MPIGAANPSLIGVEAQTLIGSTLFQQEKTREGGHFDVDYKPTDKMEINLDGFYSKLTASNVNDNYMYWGSNELNNNLPSSFTVKNNTLTSVTWPLVVPTTPITSAPGGFAGQQVDGIIVDNIYRPGANAYTYYINLDGKFQVTDTLTVKGKVGYTQGQGQTASSPFFESDAATGVSFQPSGNGWQVMPTAIDPASPAGLNNDFAINETFAADDKEIYGQGDADWAVDHGVFKDVAFGFHANEHTRQVDGWDRGCSLGANGACWTSPPMPFSATNPVPYPSGFNAGALGIPGLLIPLRGDPQTITNIINAIPGGIRGPISAIVQPQNYYWPGTFKVQENDYAGYVMAHVAGDGWRGNFGVRLVETDENAFVNVPDSAGLNPADIKTSAFGDYYVDHVTNNYFDVLPSANFVFDLKQNLLLRVSAAETMSRPDYSALGGTVTLTDLTLTGNGGNANLKPIKSANFDAALEWYYAPQAVAAVSVFYDDLSSYVTFEITHGGVARTSSPAGPAGHPVYSTFHHLSTVQHLGPGEGRRVAGSATATVQLRLPGQLHPDRRLRRPGQRARRHLEDHLQHCRVLREQLGERAPRLYLPLLLLRRARPLDARTGSRQRLAGRLGQLHPESQRHAVGRWAEPDQQLAEVLRGEHHPGAGGL